MGIFFKIALVFLLHMTFSLVVKESLLFFSLSVQWMQVERREATAGEGEGTLS